MGNICGCCGGNDQAEKHEYTPIATSEPVRQPDRTNEKSSSNFQTILDNASSGFLFTKPKYKDASSPDGIDAVRNRIKSAKVDLSTIESSPILIRPTSVGGGNGESDNHQNNNESRQNVVSLLSNPGNSSKTKKLESRAVEIVQVIRQSEEKVMSYQQENLPLASFGKGSEK